MVDKVGPGKRGNAEAAGHDRRGSGRVAPSRERGAISDCLIGSPGVRSAVPVAMQEGRQTTLCYIFLSGEAGGVFVRAVGTIGGIPNSLAKRHAVTHLSIHSSQG